MPFDANLVLHDGTAVTADISPTSETRTSGSAVIDLQKKLSSPIKGLSFVLVMTADLAETSDTLQVTIEECATVDGTYRELARFPLLTKGTGMPGTYIIRGAPVMRYIRGKIDVNDDDGGADFSATFHLLIDPYAYHTL